MALPIEEAQRIKEDIEQHPYFEGHSPHVSIIEPNGETAVTAEIGKLDGRQIQALIEINKGWSWFIDDKSERGLRVVFW